jgi:hypothetical protein
MVEPTLRLVNLIIEQAFGKGFKGNYDYAYHSGGSIEGLKEISRLCLIGRKKFSYYASIGQLGNRYYGGDGSAIAIFQEHESEAKKYAELYRQNTGREVTIILTKKLNPLYRNLLRQDEMSEQEQGDYEDAHRNNLFLIDMPDL